MSCARTQSATEALTPGLAAAALPGSATQGYTSGRSTRYQAKYWAVTTLFRVTKESVTMKSEKGRVDRLTAP